MYEQFTNWFLITCVELFLLGTLNYARWAVLFKKVAERVWNCPICESDPHTKGSVTLSEQKGRFFLLVSYCSGNKNTSSLKLSTV